MSLINLITNHADDILLVGGALYGALWNHGRNVNFKKLGEDIQKIGKQALSSLLRDPHLYDDAYVRATIADTIWRGLDRLSVKRSQAIEKLVDIAVERLHAELAEQLWDRHMGNLVTSLDATNEMLKSSR